ncbi:major facilitator superfamily domain-containing protein [Lactarius pseudohatsudake]|nr:major facilitator superfamily domain-containing protein [Lactarius pseudohatsudake]
MHASSLGASLAPQRVAWCWNTDDRESRDAQLYPRGDDERSLKQNSANMMIWAVGTTNGPDLHPPHSMARRLHTLQLHKSLPQPARERAPGVESTVNRLSDHVGRKPILLSSLVGTTLSILLFGLSRSFWALALSRCLHGAMRGYSGVIKSMIAELTDETNVARGFSMPPVAWSLGYVIGPLIGGGLSRPQDRWPHIFSHPFWVDYPYFLPCLVAATFTCLSFVITALYLEETINLRPSAKLQHARRNSDISQGEASDSPALNEPEKPPPLRSVLTKPITRCLRSSRL